jgi:predicted nuclease with RNAse H fold
MHSPWLRRVGRSDDGVAAGAGSSCGGRKFTIGKMCGFVRASPRGNADVMTVAGVDVGGTRKGFHAVALHGHAFFAKMRSTSPHEIAAWCRSVGARVIAVDAPCRWRVDGARSGERALMRSRIHCFSTPTEAAARAHPKDYFGWMLAGAALYEALRRDYELLESHVLPAGRPVCFETFPQAIACRLAGRVVPAREKHAMRRALLREAGVDTSRLGNIDEIDAALCALMGELALAGRFEALGEARDGLIVLPRGPDDVIR